MPTPPVVLVAFRRPDLTRRTLDAVRAAAPARLLVVADGPRPGRPEESEACAATRAVLEEVDWPCEVSRRYAGTNLGLEANVELGLDWAFSLVDRAIVLEDDCLPDPTFFGFAEELLERYRDDRRVWQISGNGLNVPERFFGGHSYAFSAWASVWGWATWADRWQRHRTIFPRDHRAGPGDPRGDRPHRTVPVPSALPTLVTGSGRRHFAEAAASEDTVTHGWDKHWWLSMMTEGALAVTPARTAVENVGFGVAEATHTSGSGGDGSVYGRAGAIPFPLRHPAEVGVDVGVERELELVLARVGGRWATLARTLIRSPMLRRLARRLASTRPAMYLARTAARLTHRRTAA